MSDARTERIKMLRQYLEEDENDHFSRYALALECMEDDPSNASALFQDLLRRNPSFLAAYYQQGKAFERLGRQAEAMAAYHAGISVARQQKNLKTEQELNAAAQLLDEDE